MNAQVATDSSSDTDDASASARTNKRAKLEDDTAAMSLSKMPATPTYDEDDVPLEECEKQVREKIKTWVVETKSEQSWGRIVAKAWPFLSEVVTFLLENGEDIDETTEAVRGLINYGIDTKVDLQRIGQGEYDSFKAALARHGVPEGISDQLFDEYVASLKRTSMRADMDQTGNVTKVQVVRQEPLVGAETFCAGIALAKMDENSNFLTFAGAMLANEAYSNVMFMRACYDGIVQQAIKIVNDPESKIHNILVLGTPGTGKTVAALYALWILIRAGETVVYSFGGQFVVVFGPPNSPALAAARAAGYVVPQPRTDGSNWVGSLLMKRTKAQELLDFLLTHPEVFHIVDPPIDKGLAVLVNMGCKQLVFASSFNRKRNPLKNFSITLFMSLWTLEELLAAQAILQVTHLVRGTVSARVAAMMDGAVDGVVVEDAQIEERFLLWGGVARRVLSQNYAVDVLYYLDNICKLTLDAAKDLFNPYFEHKDVASLFVHIRSESEDFFQIQKKYFATDRMRRCIHLKVLMSQNDQVKSWANAVKDVEGGGTVGALLETCFHNALVLNDLGINGCKLIELHAPGTKVIDDSFTMPAFKDPHTFDLNDMSDLVNLLVGEYAMPMTPNFQTLDSFALLQRPFCDSAKEKTCLVGFQMTVAKGGHGLKVNGLKAVMDKVKTWLPRQGLVGLVFGSVLLLQREEGALTLSDIDPRLHAVLAAPLSSSSSSSSPFSNPLLTRARPRGRWVERDTMLDEAGISTNATVEMPWRELKSIFEYYKCVGEEPQGQCRSDYTTGKTWVWESDVELTAPLTGLYGTDSAAFQKVRQCLHKKHLVFVGDSLTREQWIAMRCWLKSTGLGKASGVQLTFVWEPYLLQEAEGRPLPVLRFDEEAQWQIKLRKRPADLLLFNVGHWVDATSWKTSLELSTRGKNRHRNMTWPEGFVNIVDTTLRRVSRVITDAAGGAHLRPENVFWRTVSTRHENKHNGGRCDPLAEPVADADLQDYTLGYFVQLQNAFLRDALDATPFTLLDVETISLPRADSHKGRTEGDCSHYCLPGAPHAWNLVMLKKFCAL